MCLLETSCDVQYLALQPYIEALTTMEQAIKWAWQVESEIWTGRSHSVKTWRSFLRQAAPDFHEWNRRWECEDSLEDWLKRWKKLWASLCHPRARIMGWRVLQEGFYDDVRGHIWKKCKSRCPPCKGGQKQPNICFSVVMEL
jgi:hypothetical protein